jgi:hypothetical protein
MAEFIQEFPKSVDLRTHYDFRSNKANRLHPSDGSLHKLRQVVLKHDTTCIGPPFIITTVYFDCLSCACDYGPSTIQTEPAACQLFDAVFIRLLEILSHNSLAKL